MRDNLFNYKKKKIKKKFPARSLRRKFQSIMTDKRIT